MHFPEGGFIPATDKKAPWALVERCDSTVNQLGEEFMIDLLSGRVCCIVSVSKEWDYRKTFAIKLLLTDLSYLLLLIVLI